MPKKFKKKGQFGYKEEENKTSRTSRNTTRKSDTSKSSSKPSHKVTPKQPRPSSATTTSNVKKKARTISSLPIEKSEDRSLYSVPSNLDDAFNYTIEQILLFKTIDTERYDHLCFIRCEDDFINKVFSSSNRSLDLRYPIHTRTLPSTIQKYIRGEIPSLVTDKPHPTSAICSCTKISKSYLKSRCNTWGKRETNGFDSLVRQSIRNQALILHEEEGIKIDEKISCDGIILGPRDNNIIAYAKKLYTKKGRTPEYAFFAAKCGTSGGYCNGKDNISMICRECNLLFNSITRLIRSCGKETENIKDIPSNILLTKSPSIIKKRLDAISEDHRKQYNVNLRLQKKLTEMIKNEGLKLDKEQAEDLFHEEVQSKAKKYFEENEIDKNDLAFVLWSKSLDAYNQKQKKGSKQVRYHPVMICFALFLRQKLNKGSYDMAARVFHMPSSRTLASYDSLDGNSQEGICHETLRSARENLANLFQVKKMSDDEKEWARCVSVSCDAMTHKSGLIFNSHTNQLVGFSDNGFDENVIHSAFSALNNAESEDNANDRPELSKEFLVFIMQTWDNNNRAVKHVVARYGVSNKIRADYLVGKMNEVIVAAYTFGFIVNNITGDGASENRSCFKQLATETAGELFGDVPNPDLPVCFRHPCDENLRVFIGGEMPHLVKKIVNALERSDSYKSNTYLKKDDKAMKLSMIENVWRDDLQGINHVRKTKLSDDHFNKNPFSRMRVHLAVQILSDSVFRMLDEKLDENEKGKYQPLME